jgi:adenylate cyclase
VLPTGQRDVEFGPFRLDLRGRRLVRGGLPVAVGRRAFDVLSVLAAACGEAVGKGALLEQVWSGLTVEENNLQVQISGLRKALGEGWITTVPGRGYRLAVPSRSACLTPGMEDSSGRPSIVVMPFASRSRDLNWDAWCGIADDIITELSRDRTLLIIAHHSSLKCPDGSVDPKQVGRALGVRYVLQGSVRRETARVRVSVQLSETTGGGYIWAERYDRALDHVSAFQDEISAAVATAVRLAVGDAEQRRMLRKMPEGPSSWEAYIRGLWHLKQNTPEGSEQSRRNFRQACDIDPGFASGFSGLAFSYLSDAIFHGTLSFVDAGKLAESEARKAIAVDPDDSDAYAALAHAYFNVGNSSAAMECAERALALNQNSAWAHTVKATVLVFSGQYGEGRKEAFKSLWLNPRDPSSPLMPTLIVASHYWEGNYNGAVDATQRCLTDYPSYAPFRRFLVAALGQLGRKREAAAALQDFITVAPAVFSAMVRDRPIFLRQEQQQHLLDGLQRAD